MPHAVQYAIETLKVREEREPHHFIMVGFGYRLYPFYRA